MYVLIINASKSGVTESFSISRVNLILLWKIFNVAKMGFLESIFSKRIVSSTYPLHFFRGKMVLSSSTMKIYPNAGSKGGTMAKKSVCKFCTW